MVQLTGFVTAESTAGIVEFHGQNGRYLLWAVPTYNAIMVFRSLSVADRSPPPQEWIAARRASEVLLTGSDVRAMIGAGIVAEDARLELLHGVLLHTDRSACGKDPLTVGNHHTISVEALSDLRAKINSADRHVRTQQPLACSETHQPQPDFMVVRGPLRGLTGIATAADVFCVVEVADSSYERDAGEKLFGYARAGIGQYVIINLRRRNAEVYTNPDRAAGTYPPALIVEQGQELSLWVGEGQPISVPVADALP